MKTKQIDEELQQLRENHRKLMELKRLRQQVAELSIETAQYHHDAKRVFMIILEIVAKHFKVEKSSVLSKRRLMWICWPRQVLMTLTREFTNASLAEIGEMCGGRDHGTVIHAENCVRNRCLTDKRDALDVKFIQNAVKEVLSHPESSGGVKIAPESSQRGLRPIPATN